MELEPVSGNRQSFYCLTQGDESWSFLWGSELLYVEYENWGWKVEIWGVTVYFDELYVALDWLDEQRHGS